MVFTKTLLLLIVKLTSVQLWSFGSVGKCNFKYKMMIGQVVTINNPNWPGLYKSGDNCRWTFDCPFGYFCHLRCYYIGIPYSTGCTKDKLLVSTVGETELNDAEVYCGRINIKARSTGTRIVIGLVTSENSTGGRFKCAVRSEPVIHIDSFIHALGIKTDFKTLKKIRGHKLNLTMARNTTSSILTTKTAATTKFDLNYGLDEQFMPTKSPVEAIIHAIGFATKRNPLTRTRRTSSTQTIKPLELLLNFLRLKPNHSLTTKRRLHLYKPITTPIIVLKRTKVKRIIFATPATTTEQWSNQPSRSIFDILVEAMA